MRVVKRRPAAVAPAADRARARDSRGRTAGSGLRPGFAHNGHVYVCWTDSVPAPHEVIDRFTVRGDQVIPGSRMRLVELDRRANRIHVGGALRVGPDGELWVGAGTTAAVRPRRACAPPRASCCARTRRLGSGGRPVHERRARQVRGDLGAGPSQSVRVRLRSLVGPSVDRRCRRHAVRRDQRGGGGRELRLADLRGTRWRHALSRPGARPLARAGLRDHGGSIRSRRTLGLSTRIVRALPVRRPVCERTALARDGAVPFGARVRAHPGRRAGGPANRCRTGSLWYLARGNSIAAGGPLSSSGAVVRLEWASARR